MYTIKCGELTGEECDFVVEGATKEETKDRFYAHGAESPIHKEKYYSASDEDKAGFEKEVDKHLAGQM